MGTTKAFDQKTRGGSPDRFGYEWAKYSAILPESKALAAERLPIMDQLLATFEAETFGLF